jgi:predicted DNA-binding protein
MPPDKKKHNMRIFIIPKKLDEKLRREAYHTKRSRSDIVREALYVYFAMRQ